MPLQILKVKGRPERWPKRWPNDDHFLGFWVLTDIPTEKDKMASLLSRNHSFSLLLLLFLLLLLVLQLLFALLSTASFQSLAHFMSANTKPSGTIGDTQKTMTFQPRAFADTIGLFRCAFGNQSEVGRWATEPLFAGAHRIKDLVQAQKQILEQALLRGSSFCHCSGGIPCKDVISIYLW